MVGPSLVTRALLQRRRNRRASAWSGGHGRPSAAWSPPRRHPCCRRSPQPGTSDNNLQRRPSRAEGEPPSSPASSDLQARSFSLVAIEAKDDFILDYCNPSNNHAMRSAHAIVNSVFNEPSITRINNGIWFVSKRIEDDLDRDQSPVMGCCLRGFQSCHSCASLSPREESPGDGLVSCRRNGSSAVAQGTPLPAGCTMCHDANWRSVHVVGRRQVNPLHM